MVSCSEETLDITVDVVILPGYNEGLSRRGAWFAHVLETRSLLKKVHPGKKHVLRYLVNEPDSKNPMSDAEIDHLLNEITSALDQYRSSLERLEMQYRDIRKRGKLNALIYLLGILTVRWYWWIFLTRGEMSFNNSLNAADYERAQKTTAVISRFWERAESPASRKVLNETCEIYKGLPGAPLYKYRELRDYALKKINTDGTGEDTAAAWLLVARGYRGIIRKLTGKSLLTEMLPKSFGERLIFFFQRSYRVPEPECIFPVRNLNLDLEQPPVHNTGRCIIGRNRVDGNIMEIYALASRSGPPVCIPVKQAMHTASFLTRTENVRRTDSRLEVILHVGSDEERQGLLGTGESCRANEGRRLELLSRIQNASLDTVRQNEALLSYYMKEQLPVLYRRFQVQYPFRSRLHGLFPWLFITNGIPIASVLAGVWLFIDPYYTLKFQNEYDRYFSRILEGIDWSYHNLVIRVETDPALGYVNERIRQSRDGEGFRDVAAEIGRYALPVSVMDRVVLNNLTMETRQLDDFKKEANNFTTLPMYFFNADGETQIGGFPGFSEMFRNGGAL